MVWGMCSNLVVNALFFAAELRLIQAGFAPWSDRPGRDRRRASAASSARWSRRGIIERTATGG